MTEAEFAIANNYGQRSRPCVTCGHTTVLRLTVWDGEGAVFLTGHLCRNPRCGSGSDVGAPEREFLGSLG